MVKAFDNFIMFRDLSERIEKYMFVGQGHTKIGDLIENGCKKQAIETYKKAQEVYLKECSCPIHFNDAKQKCLIVQLEIQDINGAIGSLERSKWTTANYISKS